MSKNNKITVFIGLLLIALIFYFLFPNRNWLGKPYLESTQNDGFAVVELFTSEGCSSCPPADALMAKFLNVTAAGQSAKGLKGRSWCRNGQYQT